MRHVRVVRSYSNVIIIFSISRFVKKLKFSSPSNGKKEIRLLKKTNFSETTCYVFSRGFPCITHATLRTLNYYAREKECTCSIISRERDKATALHVPPKRDKDGTIKKERRRTERCTHDKKMRVPVPNSCCSHRY